MIHTIAITKINRGAFPPHKPVSIMISFFDKEGNVQGSQLISANLLDSDIQEGQGIDFRKPIPEPVYIYPENEKPKTI